MGGPGSGRRPSGGTRKGYTVVGKTPRGKSIIMENSALKKVKAMKLKLKSKIPKPTLPKSERWTRY